MRNSSTFITMVPASASLMTDTLDQYRPSMLAHTAPARPASMVMLRNADSRDEALPMNHASHAGMWSVIR